MKPNEKPQYKIILPNSGIGHKEIKNLYKRRKEQVIRAISKLEKSPTDFTLKGIEKLQNSELGGYSIRISKGDRIFYDVDQKQRTVYLLRAGKHDLYRFS